jgi:hypothetical protein
MFQHQVHTLESQVRELEGRVRSQLDEMQNQRIELWRLANMLDGSVDPVSKHYGQRALFTAAKKQIC